MSPRAVKKATWEPFTISQKVPILWLQDLETSRHDCREDQPFSASKEG